MPFEKTSRQRTVTCWTTSEGKCFEEPFGGHSTVGRPKQKKYGAGRGPAPRLDMTEDMTNRREEFDRSKCECEWRLNPKAKPGRVPRGVWKAEVLARLNPRCPEKTKKGHPSRPGLD